MNKISKLLLAGAFVLGLSACSSDEPNPTPDNGQGDLYTTITLNFGTRSKTNGEGTSSDGTEEGTLSENNVKNILVVLATKETDGSYKYVTSSNTNALKNNNANTPTYVVRFETQALYALAGSGSLENPEISPNNTFIYVFTYCNPTEDIVNTFKTTPTSFVDNTSELNQSELIWADNSFLMTNADIHSMKLPSQSDLINKYNKETNPFDLGTVDVQRVASRFDIADYVNAEGSGLANNTYAIKNAIDGETIDAYITMDGVALFNEAKKFYHFMHTSTDGTATNWNLCGKDSPALWVVSPYYSTTAARATSEFNYPMNGVTPDQFTYTSFEAIKGNRKDNWTANSTGNEYHFWTYTTPNTMPGAENQIHGNTTGVLYRAYITAAESNTALKEAMEAGRDIYAFEGVMFGDTTALHAYVKTHPASAIQEAFDATFDITKNCAVKDGVNPSDKFNVYTKDLTAGKYYCYYYYYNRHNDNGNDGLMGTMEFATVRNNVYKLQVTEVLQYGKPKDKPDQPDDKDEKPETYFKVSVEVLPWVVRVNGVKF